VHVLSDRVEPGNSASVRLLDRLGFLIDGQSEQHIRYVLRGDGSAGRERQRPPGAAASSAT
jgi:RimJ/RimL family protein N-acetyltransferase